MLGENAPSQLILYHYSDLKEEKGVVLMTAEMDPKFIVRPLPHCSFLWCHLAAQDPGFVGKPHED